MKDQKDMKHQTEGNKLFPFTDEKDLKIKTEKGQTLVDPVSLDGITSLMSHSKRIEGCIKSELGCGKKRMNPDSLERLKKVSELLNS